jgi:ABC-type transport system substrate-binding protein
MNQTSTKSGLFRKLSIGLGLALAVSTVGVTGSSAAKVAVDTKSGGNITVVQWDQLLNRCYANPGNGAQAIMKSVFEGLFEQRTDGQIVPFLAESYSVSADYKTWTIKIRKGIKYHDDEPLTAENVALNLNTIQGQTTLSRGLGANLHLAGSGIAFLGNVKLDGITASGDNVIIQLYNPRVDLLNSMYASGRFYLRSTASINDKTKCEQNPAGTGPFKWSGAYSTDTIKVVKNANYWRKDKAGIKLPYLESITFKYVPSGAARANAVRSGSAELGMFASSSDAKQMSSLLKDSKVNVTLTGNNYYPVFAPNVAIAPFNNKNARLAVAYAFDQNAYFKARNCTNGKCFGEVRDSIVGKQNIMYNTAGLVKFDLAKAKAAVAAYKKDTGKDLSFTIQVATADDGGLENTKYLAKMLEKAGMKVAINQTYSSAELVNLVYPGFTDIAQGKLNPFEFTTINVYENKGTDFIAPFLPSNAFSEPGNTKNAESGGLVGLVGKQLNTTRHSDTARDALIWTALSETNQAKRSKAWKAVTKYIQEEAFNVPVPGQQYGVATSKKLLGYDKFTLVSGGQGIAIANYGINYSGVYLQK